MASPIKSEQAAEQLVGLVRVSTPEKDAIRKALYMLMHVVRAEVCLAVALDLQQVERAMSDRFEC